MADDAQGTEVDFNALQRPFPDDKIQWRIRKSGTKKNGDPWAKIVPYPDARALMDRLDTVCGPHRWRTDFITGPQGGVICSLAIHVDGEWVAKEDGAENTDIESVKGGLTDAFKRVCVMWNVGGIRRLYGIGDKWAEFHQGGQYEDRIDGEYYRWDPPALESDGPPERDNYEDTSERPMTDKQRGVIRGLLSEKQVPDARRTKIEGLLDDGMSAERASKCIEWLKGQPDAEPEPEDGGPPTNEDRIDVESWFNAEYGDEAELKLRLALSRHPLIICDGEPDKVEPSQWEAFKRQVDEYGIEAMVSDPKEAIDG